MSPSPSKSIAITTRAASAFVVITCSVKLSEPLFSYQATISSRFEPTITSISPSSSKSMANTERGSSGFDVIKCSDSLVK